MAINHNMEIILVIYIVSVIGAILTIRYDSYFNKDSWILFILFCPLVNSVTSIIGTMMTILILMVILKSF